MFKAESYAGYKLCWPGDLVINSLWAWSRGLGVTQHHGIVSTAYGVYRSRNASVIEPKFMHELVRSEPFHWELRVRSKGVWTSRLQLTDESFLNAPILLPPLPEQAAIVRFLDYVDRRIQRYIRAKQKLIKLLEEQKQVVIHEAVTGRINVRTGEPYPAHKPSGVEWLGDVPDHWEVVPLKRIAWFKSGAGFPVIEQGGQGAEIPFLRVSDMTRMGNEIWIEAADSTVPRETAIRLGAFVFPVGSIIFPKVGGALLTNKRRLLRVPSCIDNNVMGCVVRAADLDFVFTLLQQLDLGRLAKPGPVPAIGEGDVREIRVAVPPASEQAHIVRSVRARTASLVTAISSARREIDLLREYRTRLIADVVTGKLDVREAAAILPEEVEEAEPLDEVENLLEDEEAMVAGLSEGCEERDT
jgi:type I restriction enzyme, S subunit